MSKIGRKPIPVNNVKVEIDGQAIRYDGPLTSGTHILPSILIAKLENGSVQLFLQLEGADKREVRSANRLWGLHRALLANTIYGSHVKFIRKLEINGLGYKAVIQGKNIVFSLGYSHKITFALPDGVSVEVNKTGQKMTLSSSYKDLLGDTASKIRSLRKPEPYKGTGIKYAEEVILRKAGKKAS